MRGSFAALCCAVVALTACGTSVPNIQEVGDDTQGEFLIKAIVGSVHCEIRNAINTVLENDEKDAKDHNHGVRYAAFLDDWGAQVALTLTVEEKTTVSPIGSWAPSSLILGASATVSSDATRKDTLSYFYSVKDLRRLGDCPTNWVQSHPPGSLLIQSDLKLAQWLSSQVELASVRQITVPRKPSTYLKQNAMSHEVKFEVITTGGLNPGVKLTKFTLNQSGSLFEASRDRSHDLIITLGPVDKTQVDTLAPVALGSFFNAQLGATLSSLPRGSVLP